MAEAVLILARRAPADRAASWRRGTGCPGGGSSRPSGAARSPNGMYSSIRRTTSPAAKKRRFQGASAGIAVRRRRFGERCGVGGVGSADEVVQDAQRAAPASCARSCAASARSSCRSPALAQNDCAVSPDPGSRCRAPTARSRGSASNELRRRSSTRIGGLIGRQHAERAPPPTRPCSLMWRGLNSRLLAKSAASASMIARISARPSSLSMMLASNSASHPFRPCSSASRSSPGGRRCSRATCSRVACSSRRIGDELLVRLLSSGEAGLVVAGGHVGGPEQVFLGLVDGGVGMVQVVEVLARALHILPIVPLSASGRLRPRQHVRRDEPLVGPLRHRGEEAETPSPCSPLPRRIQNSWSLPGNSR